MVFKAALPKADYDKLPEADRGNYKPAEGMQDVYLFALEPVTIGENKFNIANEGKILGALQRERAAREAAEEKIKAVGDLDIPAARDALGKVKQMAGWTPEQKMQEKIDAAVKQVTDQLGKKISGHEKTISEQEQALEDAILFSQAAALCSTKEINGDITLLRPFIREHAKVLKAEKDGKTERAIRVIDPATGETKMVVKDGAAKNMELKELLEAARDGVYGPSWTIPFGGSGATGPDVRGARARGGSRAAYMITEEEAKDPVKYQAAKKAAKEAGKSYPEIS